MGCLLLLAAGAFPRLAMIVYWIARPGRVDAAYDSALIPVLGIVFLPLTTLVYTLLHTPGVGVTGAEWVWVVIAALFDIGHAAAGANRRSATPRRTPA
jgi:hypothetical protein